MSLKSRIVLLVVLAAVALCVLSTMLIWWHDKQLTHRYHESLLQAQRIAWNRLQDQTVLELQDASGKLLAEGAWSRAWKGGNRESLGELLRPAGKRSTWRADVFDGRRALVYSTSTEVPQSSLIEAGWVARALRTDRFEVGLSQVSRDHYAIVVARGFGQGSERGVLALGLDVAQLLPDMGETLAGDNFVLNLHGREVAGTRPGGLEREQISLPVRSSLVDEIRMSDGRRALAVVQPLPGPDKRRAGALLLLRDVTAEHASDQREFIVAAAGALLFVAALGTLLFAFLRRAMLPLERSVRVLGALSQGDLHTALDEDDLALPDEAGRIARGVEALRGEMLNLQMLREERIRMHQQQERLIRRQLKLLAESLDAESRDEILKALEPESRTGTLRDSGNELAELAGILGRLSGLVSTQQSRLVQLLQDLRAAMGQQALLASLKQELEIARTMQMSILPRTAPPTRAAKVEALIQPAKEVGGDFYDYFMLDEHRLAVVVADVSGKGVPAAFFMAISRTLLKANALFLDRPGDAIARLNEQLCAENEQMMFVTLFFAELHLRTGELVFVNAGHNPPVLRHSASNEVSLLPKGRNTALAVMEGLPYEEGRVTLAPGDTLLLYTDGVTEATNAGERLFGEAALLDTVRAHDDGPGLPASVLEAVRVFEAGAPQADDITCVALHYRGMP